MIASTFAIQLTALENRINSLERLVSCADRLEALQDALGKSDTRQQVVGIVDACCDAFSGSIRVSRQDVFNGGRPERIIIVRHAVMTILYEELGMTMMQVGEAMGGKDHGTVRNGIIATKARADTNQRFREKLTGIRDSVKAALRAAEAARKEAEAKF